MKTIKYIAAIVIIQALLHSNISVAQTIDYIDESRWVDSVFNSLTLEQRIGQLMIVRVPTQKNTKKQKELYSNIQEYYAGGVCFFGGTANEQLQMTKKLQTMAPVPLLISIDAEWGLGMRLKDAYSFPRQMMMGAIENDSIIYDIASEIGRQCRKMGIHINFAPCIDINSNPMNPVIGARSFGENRHNVAHKGIMYAKGLENNGVMAVAKHFPGHGDTDVDSHHDLPMINHTKEYLDSIDLYPFKQILEAGIGGIMIGHLQVDAYDSTQNQPSSLSHLIVNNLLKKQMNCKALVFSDGMDMKAVTDNYKDGSGELAALKAGIDIILLPDDMPKAVQAIAQACTDDSLLMRLVDLKCKKILKTKYRYGLNKLDLSQLSAPTDEDYARCEILTQKLSENAVTVLKNKNFILPLQTNNNQKILSVVIGRDEPTTFTSIVDNYARCTHYYHTDKKTSMDTLKKLAQEHDIVLVSIYAYANPTSKKNYGITANIAQTLDTLQALTAKVIVVGFVSAYGFTQLPNLDDIDAIVLAYQNVEPMQVAAANAVFGGININGHIPVSASKFSEGLGKKIEKVCTPSASPTMVNMNAETLTKIDTLANYGIKQGAYPGCQILVAKDGYIVYNKAFGHYTYDDNSTAVSQNTMYDIASVTKIAATTLAVMKLVDEKEISLNDPLSKHLPYLKHTNKKNITIREALSHYAQLQAFIPFWKDAVNNNCVKEGVTNANIIDTNIYSLIADNFYVEKTFRNEILEKIADSKLTKEKKYLYSDFGFILLADMVQQVSGMPLDAYVQKHFYRPLGLTRTTFNPLQHNIDINDIAPTENDKHFRHSQIQGYVHDENAALMGGVAGHAGLFSNTTELAILMQLLLNEGIYNGKQYLSKDVINIFNTRHYAKANNRRALGFDKPFIKDKSTHVSPMASQSSFGHSGFTGTFVWVDPQYNLIYIFLANRVYPDSKDNKLSKLNIRTDIQDIIYKALNTK